MNSKQSISICAAFLMVAGCCFGGNITVLRPQSAWCTNAALRSMGSVESEISVFHFPAASPADGGISGQQQSADVSKTPVAAAPSSGSGSGVESGEESSAGSNGGAGTSGGTTVMPVQPPAHGDSILRGCAMPIDIWTSGGAEDYSNGWKVLDGDLQTVWSGVPATGGCWTVFTYDPGVVVSNVAVSFAEGSATNVMLYGATEVNQWSEYPVGAPLKAPVLLNYLWFIFPADTAGGFTRINEIVVNGNPDLH